MTDTTTPSEDRLEDLPPSANYVYDVLGDDGELSAAELADRTNLPVSTVYDALRRLQSEDAIESRPDPGSPGRLLYDIRMSAN